MFGRRRRRARAARPHAAHMPRRLSFRRRRHRPRTPAAAPRPLEALSFRRARRRPLLGRARTEPRRWAAAQRPARRRLSFRRGRSALAGPRLRALLAPLAPLVRRRRPRPAPRRAREPSADRLRLTARLVAVGFAACMLQLLVISQIGVLGVSADVAPLVVVAAGLLCGSLTGACFGFAVGLFIDLAFVQVLGISSLLFTAIGYAAGRLRELRAPDAPLARLLLGAAATVLALGGYGAIEFMLGVNAPVSYGLLGAIVKETLLNCLIALPVYALTRRALLGALPAGERDRNRAATTTRVSPLPRG
ncbi:MAG TPA: rod shape-determining protein MreD [Solirubrobacteraceae bacterium]|nr:rod shape-determining protein MreD [Solirubrobacteraceae bacterium]